MFVIKNNHWDISPSYNYKQNRQVVGKKYQQVKNQKASIESTQRPTSIYILDRGHFKPVNIIYLKMCSVFIADLYGVTAHISKIH